jgi:branched-chain amino acid transport system ATP-binding protein
MSEVLLRISGLTKRFGGLVVTDDLHLEIHRGTTHAIIGPNGAGKTTLVNQIQGELRPDDGQIRFSGNDITNLSAAKRAQLGISRTYQITSVFPEFSVLANLAFAIQAGQGHSFHFWKQIDRDPTLLKPAQDLVAMVGLDQQSPALAKNLSHGERRQLEIGMAMATGPSLLLLDEPMAGMGKPDAARMTKLLKRLNQTYTILLIEHDMDTVFQLADRITVLVSGKNIATGSPSDVRDDPRVRAAYLGHSTGS